MASDRFLSEFPPVPTEDWESAIRESVAGPELPAKLIWHPEEGPAVKPYYRAEDLAGLTFLHAVPGEFPYVRGARGTGDWRIREGIDAADPAQANRTALDAVAAGSDEIEFRGFDISGQADLARLVANLERHPLRLHGLSHDSGGVEVCLRAISACDHVSADLDPFGNLDASAELCCEFPNQRLLSISAEEYEESGVGVIEQLAFLLSAGAEFLDEMVQRNVSIERAAGGLGFAFSVGPKFFVEVAKLRGFRLAWSRVVESFGGDAESAKPVMYARTARWNETVYDPHLNILRATTEAMSAVVGGADSVAVAPFDQSYRKPNEASRRLARNLQLVLKHEAGLARVTDPLGGAYLIEALTNKIAIEAWKLFQQLEAGGGYSKVKSEGTVDSVVRRMRADRSTAASQRKLVLTGTNRFANVNETALERIESGISEGESRVARDFEAIRLRTEKAAAVGRSPKVVLAKFGDAKMSDARAQFAKDFLACAGMGAKSCSCSTAAEIASVDADLIVLCSSDLEYLPVAEQLMQILKQEDRKPCVAIAGNPRCAEDLSRLGIEEFIYLGSHAPKVLMSLQHKLGIEG